MNEGEYLDLCNQLKDLNDERDNESKQIKEKLNSYKKELLTIYGFIRTISNMLDPNDIDTEIYMLIEILRGKVSELVEEEILQYTKNWE